MYSSLPVSYGIMIKHYFREIVTVFDERPPLFVFGVGWLVGWLDCCVGWLLFVLLHTSQLLPRSLGCSLGQSIGWLLGLVRWIGCLI